MFGHRLSIEPRHALGLVTVPDLGGKGTNDHIGQRLTELSFEDCLDPTSLVSMQARQAWPERTLGTRRALHVTAATKSEFCWENRSPISKYHRDGISGRCAVPIRVRQRADTDGSDAAGGA